MTPPTTVEQRALEVDTVLNEYENSLRLPAYQVTQMENEAKFYLEMETHYLRKMTATECGEASYTLSRFALFIQRSLNRERARLNWAEKSITRLTARVTVGLSNYYHREERLAFAVSNDEAAKKYDAIRVHAQTRIDRLDFLAMRIQEVAETLKSLQYTKRGNRE